MGLLGVKDKMLLYHLTKVNNMDSIIQFGLLSRKALLDRGLFFDDVADSQIIKKRDNLDMFIPFHFHPYSVFDVAVKNTYNSEKFVYICISRKFAQTNNFKVIIKHPLSSQECILYNYDDGFNRIDWDTMEKVGATDEYSRCVKMAECLTDQCIPAESFYCIYVPDEEIELYIRNLLKKKGIIKHHPYINIQPKWF